MKQKSKRRLKKGITNTLGALGYLSCFLQWLWSAMLYSSVALPVIVLLAPPAREQAQPAPSFTFALPSLLETIIVAAVVIVMVALTAYALVKMPLTIAKTSRKAVHKTTEKIVPLAIKAQHKKDTKRLRALLTARVVVILKALIVIIPVALTASSGWLEELPLSYSIGIVVGGILAGFSVGLFAVQYLAAGLLRVKLSELW